jgi:hypothetical protein
METIVEAFLKGLDDEDQKYVKYMTKDQFSDYLRKKGFSYPTHSRPGSRYINVFGSAKRVNTKKPYGLIVYHPRKQMREEYFETPEAALTKAPDGCLWQILNLWTLDVIYDQFNMRKENGSDK